MMFNNVFFVFNSRFSSSTIQAHMTDLAIDYLDLVKGNYREISFPVKFKQEYGSLLKDMLNTGTPSLFLISEKMKIALEHNHLTGWKTFPVTILDKKGNEIPGYHGFSVTGRCKSINFDKSEVVERQIVVNGPVCKYYKGMFIDEWDGTDFFSPENKGWLFVTKNAADNLKKNKLTNILLENLADYEVNASSVNRIIKNDRSTSL